MAKYQGATPFQLIAGTTFAKTDLYKFVFVSASGQAVVTSTTSASNAVGTLHSVTNSTAGAGTESVAVYPLVGKGPLRLVSSTAHAGNTVAPSSAGYGIAPSTDGSQVGIIVSGTSGAAGRIATVAFAPPSGV